ncbi:MAG TPA: hypothetical protein VIG99_27645 [Myxococcaceae bacterium]
MPIDLSKEVRRRGAMAQADAVSLVAGEPIRGSWWAHPRGEEIFQALSALADDPDVVPCKGFDGKQRWIHRTLWPALVRASRERALFAAPSAEARRLLQRAEREGKAAASGKARLELERSLLVVAVQEHTESGKHVMRLTPFERWFPADVRRAADRMTAEAALKRLVQAGLPARGGPTDAGAALDRPAREGARRRRDRALPAGRRNR